MIARKRFGQHFLTNENVLEKIVDAFAPVEGQCILEIGSGGGALTERLLDCVTHISVVELDRDLVAKLKRKYARNRLTVIEDDILNFNIESMWSSNQSGHGQKTLRVIGNLPYNISTPLLFHLLKSIDHINDMLFMLQKEVAQRLSALPGSKTYGRLSVMAALELECQCLFDVPPQAFAPPPKVESTVIRLIPKPATRQIHDRSRLNEIVKLAFCQRRKTLRNSLQQQVTERQFKNADIDASQRVENLTVDQFIRLSNA